MIPVRKLVAPVALATVVLVVLLALRPLSTSRSLSIWIVLLAAIALVALVGGVRDGDGEPSAQRFEEAVRSGRRRPAPEPAELLRMDRTLALGVATAGNARHLLSLLRASAAALLGSRHGVELEHQPDAARALLGDDVWELVRPDRPEPNDRNAPGVPRHRIEAAIARLESL